MSQHAPTVSNMCKKPYYLPPGMSWSLDWKDDRDGRLRYVARTRGFAYSITTRPDPTGGVIWVGTAAPKRRDLGPTLSMPQMWAPDTTTAIRNAEQSLTKVESIPYFLPTTS